ncbi:hypothetical protein AB0K00_21510 [Dactylosporangium sp. NPDC049525]|uniref:hypothetical protein n=1 Tax=Dactylosporangium sp. NPDC049525 TaxID=3154730 RepID=UPI00343A8C5F
MLTPDTIRALTSWLVTAADPSSFAAPGTPAVPPSAAAPPDSIAASYSSGGITDIDDVEPPYTLLVLHDGDAVDAPPGTRCLATVAVAIHPVIVGSYRRGLIDLLPDLAAALAPSGHGAALRPNGLSALVRRRAAEALTGVFTPPQAGMRLLACAIAYDDVHTGTGTGTGPSTGTGGSEPILMVRRIDAVDVDGRVYQAVRLPGAHATVLVDDEPDPLDTPATYAGLAALLAAAVAHTTATPATGG